MGSAVPTVPERGAVLTCCQEGVLERLWADVGVGELIDGEPVELQVIFLACWFGVGDGDLEYEVELVVGGAVFEVAVLDRADESGNLGVGAEFFGDLADEGDLNSLARLDVAAG